MYGFNIIFYDDYASDTGQLSDDDDDNDYVDYGGEDVNTAVLMR